MFLTLTAALMGLGYNALSFWASLIIGIPVLFATVLIPAWALRRNWNVRFSVSPYELPYTDDRKQTKRWHVQPGYQTVLLRIQSSIETNMPNVEFAMVNRRKFKRWAWQYASLDKIQVIGYLGDASILPTLMKQGNRPQPITDQPLISAGDIGVKLGEWETVSLYVTIHAKVSWLGRLSFRCRMAGSRKQARLSFAVTEAGERRKSLVRRFLSHGPIRQELHPLAVDEAALASNEMPAT